MNANGKFEYEFGLDEHRELVFALNQRKKILQMELRANAKPQALFTAKETHYQRESITKALSIVERILEQMWEV